MTETFGPQRRLASRCPAVKKGLVSHVSSPLWRAGHVIANQKTADSQRNMEKIIENSIITSSQEFWKVLATAILA